MLTINFVVNSQLCNCSVNNSFVLLVFIVLNVFGNALTLCLYVVCTNVFSFLTCMIMMSRRVALQIGIVGKIG